MVASNGTAEPDDMPAETIADTFLHSRFSVEHLPAQQRYEVWRDSIACIFDVDRPGRAGDDNGEFHASIDAHMIGSLMLARTVTCRQTWRRSPLTMARDGMDHFMIQLYDSGTQRYVWKNGEAEMPPNGLLVYDLSQEMQAETTDFSNISLILPRPMIEDFLQTPDDQHMRALDGREPLVALLREHMLTLNRQAGRLDFQQAAAIAPATAQLAAACLNGTWQGLPGETQFLERGLLTSLRRDIEARLADPTLSPASLCEHHGLSRTRLYEMFAPLGGVSAYIRERRLRAALLTLVNPHAMDQPISAIARTSGFRSDSDFSRAFQRRFGLSPRAARHHGLERQGQPKPAQIDRRYEYWLRELAP